MLVEFVPSVFLSFIPNAYHFHIDLALQAFALAVCLFFAGVIAFAVIRHLYNLIGLENHPDIKRTDVELIRARGFGCETHTVQTKDGYILTLKRIVNPLIKKNGLETKPLLLMHGMGGDSSSFIIVRHLFKLLKWKK